MNVVYIHIPKTGGSSVKTFLQNELGHAPVWKVIEEIGIDEWEQAFSITTVRNPFDRALSQYSYLREISWPARSTNGMDCTFEEWLSNPDWEGEKAHLPQAAWLVYEGRININLILRFEDIEKNWPGIPHLKKAQSRPENWRDAYTDDMLKLAYDLYKVDFLTFDYPVPSAIL